MAIVDCPVQLQRKLELTDIFGGHDLSLTVLCKPTSRHEVITLAGRTRCSEDRSRVRVVNSSSSTVTLAVALSTDLQTRKANWLTVTLISFPPFTIIANEGDRTVSDSLNTDYDVLLIFTRHSCTGSCGRYRR